MEELTANHTHVQLMAYFRPRAFARWEKEQLVSHLACGMSTMDCFQSGQDAIVQVLVHRQIAKSVCAHGYRGRGGGSFSSG